MQLRRILLTFSSLLLSLIAFDQESPISPDLAVDSFVRTVKFEGNLDSLTHHLTDRYPTQLDKATAIFFWIIENIRYDCKFYNKYNYKGREPYRYKCRDDEDCEAKRMALETRIIERVVEKKKAVCQGYSMLFKRMCDIAGLRSEVLIGYIRTEYYEVGTSGSIEHAWNSVLIDSTWHLLDATWAAGGCASDDDGKLLFFVKRYNPYYWLTPPEDFARNHYPKDTVWTLIPHYTKEKFAANPYYRRDEMSHIKLLAPGSGIIDAKKGDTIRFKIYYHGGCQKLQINSNVFHNPDIYTVDKKNRRILDTIAVKLQQYIPFQEHDFIYEFEYVVTDASLDHLDILFDRYWIMRFNVSVRQ